MKTTTTADAGSKVAATEGLNTVQIAALIRADIKSAVKAGELPKAAKYSVRSAYYSMGSSIDVVASALPFAVISADGFVVNGGQVERVYGSERLTMEAREVEAKLEAIVAAYHWDKSDMQSDYYSVRFAKHVSVEGVAGEYEAIEKAKLAASRALKSTKGLVCATGWE